MLLTMWTPIIAYTVWNLELRGRHWYLVAGILLETATIYLAYHPLSIARVTPWLHYYTFFLMVYLLLFGFHFNYENFNRALSIGLFLVFIAGDLWELPVFIYDFLGKKGILQNLWTGTALDAAWIFSHVRRLYTLASAYLLVKLTKMKFTRLTRFYLLLSVVLPFGLLLPVGLARARSLFPMATTVTRIFVCTMIGYASWYGMKHDLTD